MKGRRMNESGEAAVFGRGEVDTGFGNRPAILSDASFPARSRCPSSVSRREIPVVGC